MCRIVLISEKRIHNIRRMKITPEMIESRHLFGSHVKEVRKEQSLTQTQLGSIVGRDRSYISKLERGLCNATLDTIVLLANGLGIAPAELLSDIQPPIPAHEEPIPIILTMPREQSARYQASKF